MGCALENLLLAAPANGYATSVSVTPGALAPIPAELKPQRLARVELAPGVRDEDALYRAIPRRHTNRGPCNPHQPLPPDFLSALNHVPPPDANVRLFLFTSDADRKHIVNISSAANRELYSDPKIIAGSDRWVRLRWSEVQKFRDGLTIDAFGLPPIATGLTKMMPQAMLWYLGSHSEKEDYSNLMLSAPLIGFIAVRDRYDQQQCLLAGRAWQRLQLFATAKDIVARPCNEAVEMMDHEKALGRPATHAAMLNEITGDPTWQPIFVFYMGHPTVTAHASPRRPVAWVTL